MSVVYQMRWQTDIHTFTHRQTRPTVWVCQSQDMTVRQTVWTLCQLVAHPKLKLVGAKSLTNRVQYSSCHYQLGCLVQHWLQWSGGNMLWHVRNCPILLLLSQWVWTVQIYLHFRPRQVKWISAVVWWQSLIQSGIYGSLRYVLYVLYDLS